MSINIQAPRRTCSFGLVCALFMLAAGGLNSSAIGAEKTIKVNPHDMQQVEHGQMIYKRFCALCHGENLEGQANWRQRRADGKLPAPPHDETGHTWHHPNEVLFSIVKYGLVPPNAPEDYVSDMPAWESVLSDEDIWSVLAYIASRWPPETQKIQSEINARSNR